MLFIVACALVGCATTPEKKYLKVGSAELKLMHSQLVEALGPNVQSSDVSFHPPGMMGLYFSNPKEERIKEKQEIERELLRRYKEPSDSYQDKPG